MIARFFGRANLFLLTFVFILINARYDKLLVQDLYRLNERLVVQYLIPLDPSMTTTYSFMSVHVVLATLEAFAFMWIVASIVGWLWSLGSGSVKTKPATPTSQGGESRSPLMPVRRAAPAGHGGYTPGLRGGSGSQH